MSALPDITGWQFGGTEELNGEDADVWRYEARWVAVRADQPVAALGVASIPTCFWVCTDVWQAPPPMQLSSHAQPVSLRPPMLPLPPAGTRPSMWCTSSMLLPTARPAACTCTATSELWRSRRQPARPPAARQQPRAAGRPRGAEGCPPDAAPALLCARVPGPQAHKVTETSFFFPCLPCRSMISGSHFDEWVVDYSHYEAGRPHPDLFRTPDLCKREEAAAAGGRGRAGAQMRWAAMVPAVRYRGDAQVC